MKRSALRGAALLLTVSYAAIFMASERPAHAYLDPGSGSMLVQMVVAAVAGALLSLRLFWGRLKLGVLSLFTRGKTDPEEKSE